MRKELVAVIGRLIGISLATGLMFLTPPAYAQARRAGTPDLTGVYQLVPNNVTIPGGLKNAGSPEQLSLRPAAAAKAKATDHNTDPARDCQLIGPFRMMAKEGNLLDILPSTPTGRIFFLFEDYYAGLFREIFMDRQHDPKRAPSWNGDSVAKWEGDTLVVDTVNFNEYVWLNANAAPHSDALRLTERYGLVAGGQYLEAKVTADDLKTLTKPYTYTRYYQKVNTEVPQYVCTDDLLQPALPRVE